MVTFEQIKNNEEINTYIRMADKSLTSLGFTEHSFAHVGSCARVSKYILETLGYPERMIELVQIAAWLHDIGNLVNRVDHSLTGAVMVFRILDNLGMDAEEISEIVTSIGNHDEGCGKPVSPMSAALILADKSDVRRSRVRNTDETKFDIHDRVNYSVRSSELTVDKESQTITINLDIDTKYCSVMDYFEIFLQRMLLCRKAAHSFGLHFDLIINGQLLG